MKYLKKFEGFEFDKLFSDKMNQFIKYKRDISKFCDEYLSFLKDDGYEYSLNVNTNDQTQMTIRIVKPKIKGQFHNTENIKWSSVKDDVVPFYTFLKREFCVSGSLVAIGYGKENKRFGNFGETANGYDIDDIDNDKEFDILYIDIIIEMI